MNEVESLIVAVILSTFGFILIFLKEKASSKFKDTIEVSEWLLLTIGPLFVSLSFISNKGGLSLFIVVFVVAIMIWGVGSYLIKKDTVSKKFIFGSGGVMVFSGSLLLFLI